MLSVIVPACNEAEGLELAARRTGAVLEGAGIDYELIFVDDGSADGTWEKIASLAERDRRIRGLSFTRNFGKEAAILAGLEAAEGDCCALMDCDLQHPPEKLPEMYALWREGWELVNGVKTSRGRESRAHGLAARLFYRLMGGAVGLDLSRASDFKLMDRRVAEALLALPERRTFFRALSVWTGYRSTEVEFSVEERARGKSRWSFRSLVKYAVSNIAAFSSAPLQIVTALGAVTLLLSLALGVQTLLRWAGGGAVEGFTTVILLILFIGSILMLSLGIMGYYLGQIYTEVKARPRYLVARTCGERRRET